MLRKPASIEPLSFLLGCERSGSTWLANILDAHAGVELLMEPFAPYASLFPGFPHRHVHVTERSPVLEQQVREGLRAALPIKYSLLYQPGRPVRLRSIDTTVTNAIDRMHRRLRGTSPMTALRWKLLNLNHSEIPAQLRVRKEWPPAHVVVKELRLNLKVPVLRGAFPDAKYIVIVRNPAAQLTSVRRWLEQGRLHELASALTTLADDVRQSPGLERYRAWLGDGGRDDMLVLWWFLNYETALTDLRRTNARVLLIRHEDIAAEPGPGADAVLSFLGLPPSDSVARYVHTSSDAEPRSSSPVDTFRRSAEHSRATIRDADRALVDRLRRVANELPCSEELRGYFGDSWTFSASNT